MALVTLKNNTGVAQNVVFQGKQIILGPHEESDFIQAVADKFIEIRSPLVSVVQEEIGGVYEDTQSEIVWVANMTGNPDAPDVIKAKLFVNRQWQVVDTDNPKKKARPLVMYCDQGSRYYTAKDGALEALNLPKKEIKIPPYKRRALPAIEAKWWLNRDAVNENHFRGQSIKSRPPTDFEPNAKDIDEWSLDDLRAYLKLLDPGAEMGKSNAEVVTYAKKVGHRKEDEIAAHIEEEKHLAMKRIYFRLVDPQYPVPTKKDFMEFVHGQKVVEQTTEESAMELVEKSTEVVKRKRGRPRKKPEPEAQTSV